jgi:hypothetical protein
MLTDIKKIDLKTITFRLNPSVIKKFREMCKKHKIKQVAVIEKAMLKAIEELEERENAK